MYRFRNIPVTIIERIFLVEVVSEIYLCYLLMQVKRQIVKIILRNEDKLAVQHIGTHYKANDYYKDVGLEVNYE